MEGSHYQPEEFALILVLSGAVEKPEQALGSWAAAQGNMLEKVLHKASLKSTKNVVSGNPGFYLQFLT